MTSAHRHLVFDTAEELSIHLESDHASSLSQAQRNMLLKRGVRALPGIFDDCPLRGKTAHEIQADEDLRRSSSTLSMEDQTRRKLVNRHIESHMYEIALLSVPPYPDLVAMSQSAAVNEGSENDHGESFEERLIEEGLLQLTK